LTGHRRPKYKLFHRFALPERTRENNKEELSMKYMKMLGLVAVAAMALMAFGAGSASATTLFKNATEHYPAGTTIEASQVGSGSLKDTSGNTIVTCTGGDISGKTDITSGESISGALATLKFTNCTSEVHTMKTGSLSITHISGTTNGTVTSIGSEVKITVFGTECLYGTGAGTHLGTLTGGAPATLKVNTIVTEQEPKKFLCPDDARWEATFAVTKPNPLYVEA
jgi:hypothetical protein